MGQAVTYHDYVIKDGKFIGKFDEMYTKCDDPWVQSHQLNKYSRISGIYHIQNFNIKTILECGCGLGYYSNWLKQETGITAKGVDVSPVAINRARSLFPELDFEVADITKDLHKYTKYDCVLLSEILWYVLPELNKILSDLKEKFKGKYLIINQVFYKGTQRYGTEYFTNMKELISYIPFECVGQCEATTERDTTVETSTIYRIG